MNASAPVPTTGPLALSADDVLAMHVVAALQGWALGRKEQLRFGCGLSKHLLRTAADAVLTWGDRPLPVGATAALELLEDLPHPNTGTPEEQQDHARFVRAVARHAQAWSRDKKNQPIPPGKRSRAVALLQRAAENGHCALVEGLLDAADAPLGAVDQWWWKLPDKTPTAGWQSAIAPPGSSAKGGLALGAVALAAAQSNWKNTFVQETAQAILGRGDPTRAVTQTGVSRIALCASGGQLAQVLAPLPSGPLPSQVEQDLLAAERLGYPLGLQWWFGALRAVRPDAAERLAPALLEQHLRRLNPASLQKDQAAQVVNAWVEVASTVPVPFERIRLPVSGQPLSAAVARWVVLKVFGRGAQWKSAEETWRRLAEEGVPMEDSAKRRDADGWPEGLWWALWQLLDVNSSHAQAARLWECPGVSDALEEAVARPDLAPSLSAALNAAVKLLPNDQWPCAARTRALDAWASAMLHLTPSDVSLAADWVGVLFRARQTDPSPLGAQWVPIAATQGVHLPRLPGSPVTAEQIGHALDTWAIRPWPDPAQRQTVFQAVRLDWEWSASTPSRPVRRM